jgi:hypothetical protein
MKKTEIILQSQNKREYSAPKIEKIELDTDMCLLMASEPPPNPVSLNPGGIFKKVFKL